MRHVPLLASPLMLTALTGCLAMMRPRPPVAVPAENPLISGAPLEATKTNTITGVTADDCQSWPFNDTVTVKVTEAEICVSLHTHTEEMWQGEPRGRSSEGFKIVSDLNEGGYINAKKTGAAKISSCFHKAWNRSTMIWAFDYAGCAPNNGTVTKTTRSLRVNQHAWEFGGAEAAEPAKTAM